MIPALFHPYFGVFPLHQIAHVGVTVSTGSLSYAATKLFSKYSSVKNIAYLNVTDRKTERRSDDLLWHNRALRSIAR